MAYNKQDSRVRALSRIRRAAAHPRKTRDIQLNGGPKPETDDRAPLEPLGMKLKSGKQANSHYLVERQIGFVLRVAFQFHTAIFTSKMVDNLTQTQFATLSKIKEMGECSQSDLIRLIALDSATINGVVSRMRSRGFLEVSEHPTDRRRQFIRLTDDGADLVSRAEAIGEGITAETLALLTPTERTRLLQLLRKMMSAEETNAEAESTDNPKSKPRALTRPANPQRPAKRAVKARRAATSLRVRH
jgi:MarR family transcriptional regulator, lower aerobic nicotinate degradation pathway regulator